MGDVAFPLSKRHAVSPALAAARGGFVMQRCLSLAASSLCALGARVFFSWLRPVADDSAPSPCSVSFIEEACSFTSIGCGPRWFCNAALPFSCSILFVCARCTSVLFLAAARGGFVMQHPLCVRSVHIFLVAPRCRR